MVINTQEVPVQGYAAKTCFEVRKKHLCVCGCVCVCVCVCVCEGEREKPSKFYFCLFFVQALQAPACHENMIKVGGYILGEFGNLIAGDPRSRYT